MVKTQKNTQWAAAFQLTLAWCLFFAADSQAQFYNLPAANGFNGFTETQLAQKDATLHTGLQPYVPFFSDRYRHVADSHRVFRYITDDPALDLLFFKHLLRVAPRQDNFQLHIDPLLHLEAGRDFSDSAGQLLFTNTRGFIGSAQIGTRVYVESIFAESQSVFPDYLRQSAEITGVVPGQGRWKRFKQNGYDYAFSSGFVSLQVHRQVNVQFGHGKHKIGTGYRSLLLSDNAFNYPYVRVSQQWWGGRLHYTNIYALLMNLVPAAAVVDPNAERLFQKKAAAFHHLSLNVSSAFNLGLFQGMIWQAGDQRNRQRLTWQYFNPLIFTNLAAYGLNNRNNLLIGGDVKWKVSHHLNLYGQVMADDLSNTKATGSAWGYQAGVNWFNAFGVRQLFGQIEFNKVSEQSYFSPPGTETNQSWSHYNQGLAFTPGSGNELIVITQYQWHRLFANVKYNYQQVTASGTNVSTQLGNLKIGYLVNPAYNLNVYAGITYRVQNFSNFKNSNGQTSYVYLGIRTSLYNLYYDF